MDTLKINLLPISCIGVSFEGSRHDSSLPTQDSTFSVDLTDRRNVMRGITDF